MDWQKLHDEAVLVDLHSHPSLKSSMFHRNLDGKKTRLLSRLFKSSFWPFSERITFPKLEEGGVDVLLSTVYVLEQGWIDDIKLIKFLLWLFSGVRKEIADPTYFDVTNMMLDNMEDEVSLYNAAIDMASSDDRRVRMVKSVEELLQGIAANETCIVHSIEGAHSLQGAESGKTLDDEIASDRESIGVEILNNLEHFYNRGVAYLGLAHFYPNQCVYPVFPYPEYGLKHIPKDALGKWDSTLGLTILGEAVVEKMLELGMIVDVTHCTPRARARVYEIAEHHNKHSCIMATHTGAYEINRDLYNLEDWEIKWISDHGGVIGVIFMNYWLSPIDTKLGLKYLLQTIEHVINIGGEDVIGIGTDFDGFTDPPDEIVDASQLPRFTKSLASEFKSVTERKYSDATIKKILGGNAMRVLTEGWGKKS